MMVSPLHAFYFHEPFEQNYWPDILDELYKKNVYLPSMPTQKKGKICVDIGANVGLTTYYFSKYFEKVYSVEPAKQHIDALTTMVRQNNLSNVIVVPKAMSNKDGTTKFYHNQNQTMYSLDKGVMDKGEFEDVETISLGTFMAAYKVDHIDVLKLDMEGHESQFITSEGFLHYAPLIKTILGEWHAWTQMRQELFQHAFEKLGYKFRWRHDTKAAVFEATRL